MSVSGKKPKHNPPGLAGQGEENPKKTEEKLVCQGSRKKTRKKTSSSWSQLNRQFWCHFQTGAGAKLAKVEIKPLVVAVLQYKKANAKLVKTQVKTDKLKAKAAAIQKQIEALAVASA
jgi:hypothetical protein